MEQYVQGVTIQSAHDENDGTCSSDNQRNLACSQDQAGDANSFHGFECNICLDLVQDPIVTFCGHLYCWPCIYRWIQNPNHRKAQCPVCKTEVSQSTVIPLYGRGQLAATSTKDNLQHPIPQRPRHVGDTMLQPSPPWPSQMHDNPGNYMASPMVDPMIGMFSEMICAGIFRNSETTSLYPYPGSYWVAGISSPRMRRYIMEADKSLGRVCFFLCCCAILCLFSF